MGIDEQAFVWMGIFSSVYVPGSGVSGSGGTYQGAASLLPAAAVAFSIPTSNARGLRSLLYYRDCTARRAAVSRYGSDLHIPNDAEHLFLENVPFKF